MRHPAVSILLLASLTPLAIASPGHAAAFDVPLTHATLQAAVAAAAASVDVDNVITISVSPVVTNATVDIGNAFGPARHLVIRPAAGLERASLANGNPIVPMIAFLNAGNVTLQDLDILRNVTNGQHLITIATSEDIVIERCRLGTNVPSPGLSGFANIHISYPTNVLLRNNIFFARVPGTFDVAVDANSFNDPANALRLYNNVVSDYRTYGFRVDATIAGPLVLLRNNVAVNHPGLAPEPVAYRTQVNANPTLVTSHNSAFASAGFEQTGPGGSQDMAGLAASFVQLPLASIAPSFVTPAWTIAPAWDANSDFYRLVDDGPLHTDAGQYGFTVPTAGSDVAVTDDLERDTRPSGAPAHTDRGADQLEPVTRLDATPGRAARGLRATPRRNPSPGVSLRFESDESGSLTFEVFDAAGRRRHRATFEVAAESRGVLDWTPGPGDRAGLVFYRLERVGRHGVNEVVQGRVAVVR